MAGPVGSSIGVLTGVAVGGAATVALEPAFEIPRQDAWSRNANRILDVGLLARLVAQGGVDLKAAETEASRDGFAADKLDALVYLEQTVPGVSEALRLWRLGLIGDPLFQHVLVKAGLDQRYAAPLMQLKQRERPGIGDIAYAVVRGYLPTNIPLPVSPPTTSTNVKRFPQSNTLAEDLAADIGYDPAMLELMIARSGLSMAPGLAAQAWFRGILADDDYQLAIAEGDLRTEWGHALREASRAIPSPGEYAELWLRGWLSQTEAEDGAKRHGMVPADTDLLYKLHGRPVSNTQLYKGLARGGTYPSTYDDIPEPYRKAAQESNVRPEWASVWYEDRYTLPSAFVVRSLLTDGAIDATRGATILEHLGWPPDLAQLVADHYASKTPAVKPDPHVAKAQTTLYTEAHKAYVKNGLARAQVTPALNALAVPAAAQTEVFALWDMEKQLAGEVPPP